MIAFIYFDLSYRPLSNEWKQTKGADALNKSLQMAVHKVKVLDQTNTLSVES